MTDPLTDPSWITVSEAAARLGVSANAVKMRVKRKTLLATRNNQGWLMVSLGSVATPNRLPGSRPPETDPPTPSPTPQATPTDAPAIHHGSVMPAAIHLAVVEQLQAAHRDAMQVQVRQHEAELARTVAAIRLERLWVIVVMAVMALLVLVPVVAARH